MQDFEICAIPGLLASTSAARVPGIHAGDRKVGDAMAQLGFQLITLASESQALRRGAAAGLKEALHQGLSGSSFVGGYQRPRPGGPSS